MDGEGRGPPPRARLDAGTEDFNISATQKLTVAKIALLIWDACGQEPERFALEHLRPFDVDVQRRWPSVEKARRMLGWAARVDLRQGITETVAWLRGRAEVNAASR